MQESGRGQSLEDINRADRKEDRIKIIRTENPILLSLGSESTAFQRFDDIVNELAQEVGGVPIPQPYIETVRVGGGNSRPFVVLAIPNNGDFLKTKESIRRFVHDSFLNTHLPESSFVDGGILGFKGVAGYAISKQTYWSYQPDQIEGFVLRKNHVELRYDIHNPPSEVEFAYEAIIISLLIAGKLDLSTPQDVASTLHMRRELFVRIYQKMLRDFMPVVKREELYGVDDQLAEVETNLYVPLDQETGHPMNTLLVGAPGVGKSLASRFFLGTTDVMTVPLPISNLKDGFFERVVLPRLSRIRSSLRLPIVVLLDDVEILLESEMSVDEEGRTTQVINPQSRSRALNMLERMEDTYGIFLLCTLNHPDIEAAFLRRFHTVYFPLPSSDQRERMLRGILSQGPLSFDEYQTIVGSIVQETDGFNYNSIALIPRYVRNAGINKPKYISRNEYIATVKQALQWTRARSSLNRIAHFDKIARAMVGMVGADEV